jgi:hypothetical protein
MDRFLARLERRFGGIAIENLSTILICGMAIVYGLSYLRPELTSALMLDMAAVRHGQVWRLVTYLFLLPDLFWLLAIFYVMLSWTVLTSLEGEWGSFKFNVYYLVGMVGTTVAALLTHGAIGNLYLNASCLFAFATLFPDYEILIAFVAPVPIRWVAIVSAGVVLYEGIIGDAVTRASIAAGVANYFLFFGGDLVGMFRGRNAEVRAAARRVSLRPPPAPADARACAICGATAASGADIRVCSCEKCRATGGSRNLCLEHARTH